MNSPKFKALAVDVEAARTKTDKIAVIHLARKTNGRRAVDDEGASSFPGSGQASNLSSRLRRRRRASSSTVAGK